MADKDDAEDVVEDLPPSTKDVSKEKIGSQLLPIIVVVVLLPILSFVMTEYVLLPRIKSEMLVSSDSHVTEGEELYPHMKSSSGGHGSGEAEGGNTYEFDMLKTNLAKPSTTLIIVGFTVEGDREDFAMIMESKRPALIDTTLKVLSLLTKVDTQTPGIQNVVKNDLINQFNEILKADLVKNLYFTDFVTQ